MKKEKMLISREENLKKPYFDPFISSLGMTYIPILFDGGLCVVNM